MSADELKIKIEKLNNLISAETGTGFYNYTIKLIVVSAKAELLLRNGKTKKAKAIIKEIDEVLSQSETNKFQN